MGVPGTHRLFGEVPIAEFRGAIVEDIRGMAEGLDHSSPKYIPEGMFVAGVLSRHEFSLPRLYVERAFARSLERDGRRYRELHVPMVGTPVNLTLVPEDRNTAGPRPADLTYDIVDGDLCLYVELEGVRSETLEDATEAVLEAVAGDYETVRAELDALQSEIAATARNT